MDQENPPKEFQDLLIDNILPVLSTSWSCGFLLSSSRLLFSFVTQLVPSPYHPLREARGRSVMTTEEPRHRSVTWGRSERKGVEERRLRPTPDSERRERRAKEVTDAPPHHRLLTSHVSSVLFVSRLATLASLPFPSRAGRRPPATRDTGRRREEASNRHGSGVGGVVHRLRYAGSSRPSHIT